MQWILPGLLLTGCGGSLSYYGPKGPATPGPDGTASTGAGTTGTSDTTPRSTDQIPTTTPTTSTTSTTDTGPSGWVGGDPGSPPPYAEPPGEITSDCASVGVPAGLDDGEVDVKSHDDNLEVRTLTSPVTGWYDLYDRDLSREGTGEWNESAMVRVANATSWSGAPALTNCEGDWVAVDADNHGDPGDTLFYLGTFWFEAGDNVLELEHVCPRIRAGSCAGLEFLDDDDTTCAAGDGNSAHLDGDWLCLVEPAP